MKSRCLEAFLTSNKEHKTRGTLPESVRPQTLATEAAAECEHNCSVCSQVPPPPPWGDEEHQNKLVPVRPFPFSTVTTAIL